MFALLLPNPSSVSAQAEPPTTPLFRASTHLTLLDVVVTDKNHNPVTGLRLEDFSLKENGKQQTITALTPPNADEASAPPPLPPNVYSNAPAYRLTGTTPTVLILDGVNTSSPDQFYARREMLVYVREHYKRGQRIAIFMLTEKLKMLQDFTSNPEVLIAILEKMQPTPTIATKLADGTPSIIGTPFISPEASASQLLALNTFENAQTQYVADRRADITLEALQRIGDMLGGLPGRKNVIWLTAGFPFALNPSYDDSPEDWRHLRPNSIASRPRPGNATSLTSDQRPLYYNRIREISARLANAQVAIYPVDVKGLSAGRASVLDQQMTMGEIAQETGGRAFFNHNDLDKSVVLAESDRAATYTLAYYPADKNWDDKYRTISVKIARPGVELAYRRGYFAVDSIRTSAARQEQALAESLQDAGADTLVTFQAKVTPNGPGKVRVDFLVDANGLSTEETPEGKKFNTGFYVAPCSADGTILAVKQADFDKAFPADVYQKILREGMRLHLDVDVKPGSDQLRVAVRDNRTGYLGTLTAAIPSN